MFIPPIIHGLRKDPEEEINDYKLSAPKKNLPKQISWESEMSPVKDQGRLGSCVGFATVAMKEWQEQKEHISDIAAGKKEIRDNNYYDLSESWVYWRAKEIDPWPNEEGTSIKFAMQVLHKQGVPTEDYWKYCDKVKGQPSKNAEIVAKWYIIKSYERVNGINELRAALNRGPVPMGIATFDEIYRPGDRGYVSYPSRKKYGHGGHAICAVGYDDFTQRIRFKNSWSKHWGDKGYGEIDYKYVREFVWDAWSSVDMCVEVKEFKLG